MRVDRLQREYCVDVVYRAFPLHPETPADGMSLEELFAGRNIDVAKSQRQMADRMEAEGLEYGERTMTYNSRLAQELAAWAQQQPQGEAIHLAMFQAYFVNNANLANEEQLALIAETAGLNVDAAREVIQSRSHSGAVETDWLRSRALGITGVPTFVIQDNGLVGAQPYERLIHLVETAGVEKRDQ